MESILCENPIKIRPKMIRNWNIRKRPIEEYQQFILVPCGRCPVCIYKNAREWAHRIELEMDYYGGVSRCAFITLTYDDKHLPTDRSVHKKEVVDFIKRVRDRLDYREIKYYAVGEYGELKGRAHYHVILMNVDPQDRFDNRGRRRRKEPLVASKDDYWQIHESWKKGFIDIDVPKSTGGSGGYVANYLTKQKKMDHIAEEMGLGPTFRLMSKALGLRPILAMAKKYVEMEKEINWPINYIEKTGKKNGEVVAYKRPLGRYLRYKLHQAAGKLKKYHAEKRLYIVRQFHKFSDKGVNQMDDSYRANKEVQDKLEIRKNKIKFKLNEV
jgi:hypothetical protein